MINTKNYKKFVNYPIYLMVVGFLLVFTLTFSVRAENVYLASTVTCKDGSVHPSPTEVYACLNEGGVRSVAPYQELKPGDICPQYYPRSGQAIPEGQNGNWCYTQEVQNNSGGSGGSATVTRTDCNPGSGVALDRTNCKIIDYLVTLINLLSGLVGIIIVAMIIYGGIEYSSAGDDPQKVSSAKKKIYNALLALIFFLFMFGFLQWIVPGGVL